MQHTGEWGEFFPPSLSPFGYNESTAYDLLPLDEDVARRMGFAWSVPREGEARLATAKIPERLSVVTDDVVHDIFACFTCGRNYRITSAELKRYQDIRVPLPGNCFFCRHRARLKQRNPQQLWERQCDRCNVTVWSTYSPNRPEVVLCETCYHSVL